MAPQASSRPTRVSGTRVQFRHVRWLGYLTAMMALLIDQATKIWAEATLTFGDRHPVLGDWLGIQLAYNAGAAFSFGANATIIVTLIAAAGVLTATWLIWRATSLPWAIGLGMILGGAAANVIDRLFRPPGVGVGHVVDFLAYFNWFIGNVADIFVFAGLAMCVILTLVGTPMRTPHHTPDPDSDAS